MSKYTAFFRQQGDTIVGNDPARGPWSADACHAGPVTGVIARALEPVAPEQQLVRLSISFVRPVPVAGFTIATDVVRAGRAATTATARLHDLDGKLCAKAKSLHLASYAPEDLPTVTIPAPDLADAVDGKFTVLDAPHGLPFFPAGIDVRYPPGEGNEPGPTTMWMKTIPLVEGEEMTPVQRACPLADCGNGISRNQEFTEVSCVNPDLTMVLFRRPESEWLASRAMSFWEPNGIGMSHAMLFDTRGPIGTALQTLILRPLGG